MGKKYDAELITEYFDAMTDAYTLYGSEIDHAQLACVNFADNRTFMGVQAQTTKEMVGVAEIEILADILNVNNKIKTAQTDIAEKFVSSVDAASNARIDEDVLCGINGDLQELHKTFDEIGKHVESIHSQLSRFSKYLGRDFTEPDFEVGRNASKELCGGSGKGGFVEESKQKLLDFDTEATAMLSSLCIEDDIQSITTRLSRSSSIMNTYQPYSLYRGAYNTFGIGMNLYGIRNTQRAGTSYRGGETPTITQVSQTTYSSNDSLFPDLAVDSSVNDGFGELHGYHNDTKPRTEADERKDNGFWKVLGGAGLVLLGITCVVLTAGAATPIVAAGAVAGTGTAIFGLSDTIEGGSDIYYGSLGDIESVSVNPLRDTVFQGDEAAYQTTENIFAFTASSMIPIGQMARAGDLTLRTGGVAVGKLVASDAAGQVSSSLVYEKTGNRSLSLITGSIASNLSGRGLNALDTTFGWSYNNKVSTVPPESKPTHEMSKPDSRKLRNNMIQSGVEVPEYPNAAHHIVAGNAQKASEARAILQKYGVDINDPANGVFLPTVKDTGSGAYHPSLHTDSYYRRVTEYLSVASSRDDVIDILEEIASLLSTDSF